MDDEQPIAEETATSPEETNSEVSDSEVENATGEENTTKGDLRVPLKQTREELRQLREQLNDPNFIYEKAKGLGLAAEEDLTPQAPGQGYQPQDVQKMVKDQMEVEKTYEKYPELRQDEELRFMVAGLINKGMSPLKAADRTFAKIKEANEKAAQAAAEEEKKVVTTQEAAQTISSTSEKNADDSEFDRLYKLSKSPDFRVQKKALIELEKIKFIRGQSKG